MKRNAIRMMILALAVALSLPLMAQGSSKKTSTSLGLRAGIQLIDLQFKGSALTSANRSGFFLGPTLSFKTAHTDLGFDVSVLFDYRDMKVDNRTFGQKSLLVPAHLRLKSDILDKLSIFFCGGPQLCLNIGRDTFQWKEDDGQEKQYSLQETTISINLGGGVIIGSHYEVGLYYNIPIGKMADFNWNTLSNELQRQSLYHAKTSVNAWKLSGTYYF